MVMPFSTKETGLGPDADGPKRVDFDTLWETALSPAIENCGYTPVRADQDSGALIVVEMIERLAMSDLVVADISIGNANVYYEIGVRHAAQRYGCVLISANWARVLFDIKQMPRVVYTMNEGTITPATADEIRKQVEQGISSLKDGESPVFQSVPGFPDAALDDDRVSRFQADVESVNELLGRVRAVRRTVDPEGKKRAALALRDELADDKAVRDGVHIEMMELLRDCAGWQDMLDWIEAMPDRLRTRPAIQEQRLLAVSKQGKPSDAIGALEQLVETAGDSSERQGLIGGRYKRLYRDAKPDDPSRATYLHRAITHYERGMMLDLNDYYPTCNLARLYRARGEDGDGDRARLAGSITLKACARARALNRDDGWLLPTLLGAAFDAQDPTEADRLAREVAVDSPGSWKLSTTIADLRVSASQATDAVVAASLAATFNRLNELLPQDERQPALAMDGDKEVEKEAKGKRKKKKKKEKEKKGKKGKKGKGKKKDR
jgi:hypothetical protein